MNYDFNKFDEYGYVLLKGLIDKTSITEILKHMDSTFPDYDSGKIKELTRKHELYANDVSFDKINKVRYDGIPLEHRLYRGEGSPKLMDTPNVFFGKRVSQNIKDIPSKMDKYLFSDTIQNNVKKVLNTNKLNFLECSMNRVFPKYPGEGNTLHIDTYGFTYNDNKILDSSEFFINVITYLDGTSAGRSATRLIPGSHKRYHEFNKIAAKSLNKSPKKNCIHQRELVKELIPIKENVVEVIADPGDVLIFHCGLIHGVPQNATEDIRSVIIQNFSRSTGYKFGKPVDTKNYQLLVKRLSVFGLGYYRANNLRIFKSNGKLFLIKRLKLINKFFRSKIINNINSIPNNRASRIDSMPYLNIGSGRNWDDHQTLGLDINGDGEDIGYKDTQTICDIDFDLGSFENLPFEDHRFKGIYTSHCLEHLREDSVKHILIESKRILQDSGCIRIVLPDLERYFEMYNNKNRSFFSWIVSKGAYRYDTWLRLVTREFAGNIVDRYDDDELYSMYEKIGYEKFILSLNKESNECKDKARNIPGAHKSFWGPKKLISLLKEIGFSEAQVTSRFESRIKHFQNKKNKRFNNTRPRISFYVEAVK